MLLLPFELYALAREDVPSGLVIIISVTPRASERGDNNISVRTWSIANRER